MPTVRVRAVSVGEVAEYELVGLIESDLANGRCRSAHPSAGRSSVAVQAKSSMSTLRGDTSIRLVAEACARLSGCRTRVADVGTGTGAIAIAIAGHCPDVKVWATDTSRCAVSLARANVRRHGLEDRVAVRHGDLLEAVPAPVDPIVAAFGTEVGSWPLDERPQTLTGYP